METFDQIKNHLQSLSLDELEVARQAWRGHPEFSTQMFAEQLRLANLANLEFGVRMGWWEDFSEDAPIAFPAVFRMDSFGPNPSFAHLVVALKIFPSLGQARKNGWDKPLTLGFHEFTKKKIRVNVI